MRDVLLVFLFGSSVSRQMTALGDIDAGILFNKIPNITEVNNIKEDLTALLKRQVDVVVLNEASPIVKMQAMVGFRHIAIRDYQSIKVEILKSILA